MKPVPNQPPSADPGSFRLALVGEAPGADEEAQSKPFCGKSGWLLNSWLAAAGVSRSQVFTGNVCQVRPAPNNNDFHLLDWHGEAVQAGIAALRADLAAFRPHCVVALGNAALHLLRHGNSAPPKSAKRRLFQWTSHVGTWRGSLFLGAASFDAFDASELRLRDGRYNNLAGSSVQDPLEGVGRATDSACIPPPLLPAALSSRQSQVMKNCDGRCLDQASEKWVAPKPVESRSLGIFKCLATYHPAATFREPSFAFPLVSDLKRAIAEARFPSLDLPPRRIVWGLAVEEIEARCAAIRAARTPVGFDIEGGLGGLQCLSFATTPSDAFVIDLMGEQLNRPRVLAAIASVLEDESVPKVCWNAAYERAILQAVASITLRGYEDGMLAWWERFSELPKGLDFVASILTREPYWAEGIGWDAHTGAPKVTGPAFWTYNAIDSLVTLEIWQHPLIHAVAEQRAPVAFTA